MKTVCKQVSRRRACKHREAEREVSKRSVGRGLKSTPRLKPYGVISAHAADAGWAWGRLERQCIVRGLRTEDTQGKQCDLQEGPMSGS